jgi:predicted metal-dependent peptidase
MNKEIERVQKALSILVLDQPFFATLALRLNIEESSEVDTFATDGKNLLVNTDWCSKLKDKEITTVLCHEVMHCANGHIWRMPAEANDELEKWNRACDEEVNWILEELNEQARYIGKAEPFPFPCKDPIALTPQFRNTACEKIYRALPKQQQTKNGKSIIDIGGMKQQKGQSQAEKEKLKQEWNQAVIQAAKVAKNKGDIPASIKRLIEEITNPKQDWKQILRDYLRALAQDDFSWRKYNQRYIESDFYLPSLYSEKAGKVVFVRDVSGSVYDDTQKEFIAEAQNCLDELSPEELIDITCDAKIHSIKHYTKGDKIDCNLVGGGGTDFAPVFNEIEKWDVQPDVLIYLTDLYGSFPKQIPDYPVIWLSTSKGQSTPFGDIIEIE